MLDDRHDILEAALPGQCARFFLAMSIGGTPELADDGAALILEGTKIATSSPFWNYPDGRIPFLGAPSVLLDGRGQPAGIVETIGVETIRLRDITEVMARAHGVEQSECGSSSHRVTPQRRSAKHNLNLVAE